MIYWQLFLVFVQVGLFSVGGGYAAIPLIQDYVVEGHGWLTMTDFPDLITIAEMTPGPIAINSATFVGMRVGGLGGAVLATLGCILPSGIIVCLLAFLYFRYRELTLVQGMLGTLRPAVVGLIAPAAVSITLLALWGEGGFSPRVVDLNLISFFIFLVSFFILRKYKVNPILVMLGAGALGAVFYLL